MNDPKAGATLYILTGLLQRLEKTNPGLIKDMIEGAKSDQASISNEILETEEISSVFKEALATLERANQLLENDIHS